MYATGDFNNIGDLVFVYEAFYSNTGKSEMRISNAPRRTNRSYEPKLRGWCGETNNVSTTARGVARVSKVNDETGKMLIKRFEAGSNEERTALQALGWSSLTAT